MSKARLKRIAPRIDTETYLAIRAASQIEGIGPSELARRAIAEYIAQVKTPQIAA
jgi:hypothetical protein